MQVAAAPGASWPVSQGAAQETFLAKRMPFFIGLSAVIEQGIMREYQARTAVRNFEFSAAAVPQQAISARSVDKSKGLACQFDIVPAGFKQGPVGECLFKASLFFGAGSIAIVVARQGKARDADLQ